MSTDHCDLLYLKRSSQSFISPDHGHAIGLILGIKHHYIGHFTSLYVIEACFQISVPRDVVEFYFEIVFIT